MSINETTRKKYEGIVKMYGKYKNDTVDDLYETLTKNGLKDGSIKNVMCALKWSTKENKYDDKIKELNGSVYNKSIFNNRFKKINWELIEEPKGNNVEDVIKGMYLYFPPRRIEDYAYMKYVEEETEASDEEYNYFIKEQKKYRFNKFKTVKTYGVQEFDIPKKLLRIIERYVKEKEIRSGEILLQYSKKKKPSERTLHNKLTEIFEVSADGLRHAYITYLYKNPKNLFNMHEVSNKMGHAIKTHINYLDKDNK